jgi:hypothetical protein
MVFGMATLGRNDHTVAFLFVFSLVFNPSFAQQTGELWTNSSVLSLSPLVSASPSPAVTFPGPSSLSPVEVTSSNVGDFIAAGLGMTHATETTADSQPTVSSITTDGDEITLFPTSSSSPAATIPPTAGNHTLSFTGNCWQQWSSFWSANSSSFSKDRTTIATTSVTTWTLTETSISMSTEHYSETRTVTVNNGAFAQTTFVTVTELVSYVFYTGPLTSTNTLVVTFNDDITSRLFKNITIVQPTCVLPSRVPECQSSWEGWISGIYGTFPAVPDDCVTYEYEAKSRQPLSCQAPRSSYSNAGLVMDSYIGQGRPICTQASVTGALCSSLVNNFLKDAEFYSQVRDGVIAGGVNSTTYTTTDTSDNHVATITSNYSFWDPSSSFAAGCTLGCHSCQINGGTVQLIYWPPVSSTWINGFCSAISGSSNDTLTVVTLGTTLTSPTIYVSFDSLYAHDSCSAFGKTYYNEIVAITNTANLSSLAGYGHYNGLGYSASFNFTDL